LLLGSRMYQCSLTWGKVQSLSQERPEVHQWPERMTGISCIPKMKSSVTAACYVLLDVGAKETLTEGCGW
jgi:hypothetical protein